MYWFYQDLEDFLMPRSSTLKVIFGMKLDLVCNLDGKNSKVYISQYLLFKIIRGGGGVMNIVEIVI